MKKQMIFLADDDRDDAEMFCEALDEINREIICQRAVNGEELLEKLDKLQELPSLIFLDLNMPVMNGWQCLQNLKNNIRYKDIPVIIISTSSHKEEIDKAILFGALCYFVKPNTYQDLKDILEKIALNLDKLDEFMAGLENERKKYIHTF